VAINSVLLTQYCSGDQIENNGMGGECSTRVCRVLVGKPEGENHLEGPGVDGSIILRWIFRKWDVGVWTGSS